MEMCLWAFELDIYLEIYSRRINNFPNSKVHKLDFCNNKNSTEPVFCSRGGIMENGTPRAVPQVG